MPGALLAAWLIVVALTVWWWLTGRIIPPGPPTAVSDPYAADVAAFRRRVHDWDRGGDHP